MAISDGQFSVDTFFVLSGFLGAYVGLRKLAAADRAGHRSSPMGVAFTFLLERYLRLTPLYLFMLLVYMFLIPHVMTGPMATWVRLLLSHLKQIQGTDAVLIHLTHVRRTALCLVYRMLQLARTATLGDYCASRDYLLSIPR